MSNNAAVTKGDAFQEERHRQSPSSFSISPVADPQPQAKHPSRAIAIV